MRFAGGRTGDDDISHDSSLLRPLTGRRHRAFRIDGKRSVHHAAVVEREPYSRRLLFEAHDPARPQHRDPPAALAGLRQRDDEFAIAHGDAERVRAEIVFANHDSAELTG